MTKDKSIFIKLKEPFAAEQIEWRVQSGGEKNGKTWAICLAYVTNRAIMDRLDDVVGPAKWQNDYKPAPEGGVLCGISLKIKDEWVTKWDGSDNTDIEAVKGGLSGAMKRAAVQWGIGRYLYHLEAGFANVSDKGKLRGKWKDKSKKPHYFRWDAPTLPKWALPPVKTIEEVKADIQAATATVHLVNIFNKYKEIFKGADLAVLIRVKDTRKVELLEGK